MNYPESLDFLENVIRSGIKYDLVNIRRLLGLLGHPERRFPLVCVAGTNGKGSVCAFLESILAEAGYKVGLNTSPHLVTPRERIRISRRKASPEAFAEAVSEVREASEKGWRASDPGRPTFFETMTAAALVHFRRAGVDIGILEAGLGGRLDGTNAVQPVLSVITRIAVDHPKTLGGSLRRIAFEKAGIARSGRPLLIGAQRPRVASLLGSLARFRGARPVSLRCRWSGSVDALTLRTPRAVYTGLRLSLAGAVQQENAACAVRAAEILRSFGFSVGDGEIRRGLGNALWPGRLEYREGERRVLIDCAHNPDGIGRFVRELDSFPARRRVLIYATMGDKAVRAIASRLFPRVDRIILPPLPQMRAADPRELLKIASEFHSDVSIAESVSAAWEEARRWAAEDDLIIVTGSLYLVGEFKKATGEDEV